MEVCRLWLFAYFFVKRVSGGSEVPNSRIKVDFENNPKGANFILKKGYLGKNAHQKKAKISHQKLRGSGCLKGKDSLCRRGEKTKDAETFSCDLSSGRNLIEGNHLAYDGEGGAEGKTKPLGNGF